MQVYWLDTGFLVQNRRRFHTKARVPKFWEWVEVQILLGRFKMPERVYAEVRKTAIDLRLEALLAEIEARFALGGVTIP